MTSAPASLSCPNCLRRFRWSPTIAGKKVKCPCGHLFTAPATSPTDDSLYDLVPPFSSPPKLTPSPALPIENKKPTTCPEPGRRIENPLPLSYQSKTSPSPDHDLPNKVRDFQAPLVLLIADIVIETLAAVYGWRYSIVGISPLLALAQVSAQLLIGTAIMVPAIFIAARFRRIDFGKFPIALLKLAALSIAPGAFATFVYFFLQVLPFAWLIAAILAFAFYFTAIGFLFDLDQSDTWYCVCIIFVLNVAAYFVSHLIFRGHFF